MIFCSTYLTEYLINSGKDGDSASMISSAKAGSIRGLFVRENYGGHLGTS